MKKTYEVIVAGAGPSGLWLACELRLAGVDVAVIERRAERSRQSRALTMHGRSLEIFALRGLADRFLATGKPIPTGHYAALDTRLDFSPFETSFPYTLFIPQAATEERLETRAAELGVDILRGTAVTGIEDCGDHVLVSTDGGACSALYVVGADGARSLVREQTGIAFEGVAARNTMMLADVVLGVPPARPVVSVTDENGSVMIAPLGDGVHHRIVLVDPERMHVPRSEPVTLEEVATAAERILGIDCQPGDPIWLSRFTDETRLASAYRKGRVMLVGDAAHIHAPMGGQGMNVGIQDAMNLGWKLAAVVRGRAPEILLDSYEAERRPVGQTLYANTLAQAGLVTRFDPATLALRATLNDLLAIPAANRRLAGELSGFDLAYGAWMATTRASGHLAAGGRVPDVSLTTTGERERNLYRLLEAGDWLHLAFDAGAEAPSPAWLDANAVRSVSATPKDDGIFAGVRAALVRPDGYAAAVARH
ncbi:FAD-dependent monooxygenase [Mesorhizobium sp. IMUNJ 23232]|uniref:FAD-dependent monooxygenase n=1 Tax=Mesorhizobium sp. IMUNJ 23232 TaxID=3376064 RepID=UPI00379DC2E7